MPLLLQLEVAPPHRRIVYWENTPVTGQTFTHRQTGQRFLIAVNRKNNLQRPMVSRSTRRWFSPSILAASSWRYPCSTSAVVNSRHCGTF